MRGETVSQHTVSLVTFGQIVLYRRTLTQLQVLSCTFGLLCVSLSGTDCGVTSWRKVLCVFMRHSDYAAVQKQGS